MLDENKIYQNKLSFINLLSCLDIDITELYAYLDAIDYFNKPATVQYFKAYPGGLCEYALDLYYELAQLANAYCPNKYSKTDIVKVALFKDLYRAELYESFLKNVKNETSGQWEVQSAFRYKEQRPTFGDIGFSSYMIAKRFITFTDEQIEAITQSAVKNDYAGDIHQIMRAYPLLTLTKMADIAATYLNGN